MASTRSAILAVSSLPGCGSGLGATCYISATDSTGSCMQVLEALTDCTTLLLAAYHSTAPLLVAHAVDCATVCNRQCW